MQDFNDFISNAEEENKTQNFDFINLVTSLSNKFDGKDQSELIKAIYYEAEKGKKNGTLTNEQIDGFATALSPLLDENKRKILNKIVKDLKKI